MFSTPVTPQNCNQENTPRLLTADVSDQTGSKYYWQIRTRPCLEKRIQHSDKGSHPPLKYLLPQSQQAHTVLIQQNPHNHTHSPQINTKWQKRNRTTTNLEKQPAPLRHSPRTTTPLEAIRPPRHPSTSIALIAPCETRGALHRAQLVATSLTPKRAHLKCARWQAVCAG